MSGISTYRGIVVPQDRKVTPGPQPEVTLTWLPIASLVIDDTYQRPLERANWRSIHRIAQDFSWAKFSPALVAPLSGDMAGRFALIDGQHRCHAAKLAGMDAVPAMVLDLDATEQARSFAAINGDVTRVTVFHIYRAALAAQERWAVLAEAAVARAGCQLMRSNKSTSDKKGGEVFCHGLVRRMVEKGQEAVLTSALEALRLSRHRDDIWCFSASFLEPWIAVVEGYPRVRPAVLAAFLDQLDLRKLDRAVAALREQDAYRRIAFRALYIRSLKVMIEGWAKSARVDM